MNIGIYMIKNPSGKIYIGQSKDIEKRKKNYQKTIHCKGQVRLYNSLIKHGFSNHEFTVLEYCDVNSLNARERYWQDFFDVIGLNGLNCKLTKADDKPMVLSEEARMKISKFVKENNPMKNPETKEMFKVMFQGERNPMFNKKGSLNKASKKVIDKESKMIFECIREAADFYNIKYSTLKSMINGTNKNKTNLIYYEQY
jgi:group I intron endonuclease